MKDLQAAEYEQALNFDQEHRKEPSLVGAAPKGKRLNTTARVLVATSRFKAATAHCARQPLNAVNEDLASAVREWQDDLRGTLDKDGKLAAVVGGGTLTVGALGTAAVPAAAIGAAGIRRGQGRQEALRPASLRSGCA
ncbi:hypothetical protein [Sinomonas gamaensis]|uniref:hypothetical protein n=1 Tax=Sinomonas gamaensis TaxID=2565624 RepID=UPI001109ABB2|nr:hypothetical protein [Sinomonas gamaensis]